ncbi:nucleotidyltransferase domain-containing protein [Lonsdalea iberica]|uniref:nucleotidyltransferase domain-containing protein n=1 Tax=Lonsdalea iberica TaxID=1082703 RepID=UPI003F60C3FA
MASQGVSEKMKHQINAALDEVEREFDVRILYACESGSRGWGFASPDSDYDVRFIYVHPPEWYLRVEPQRDVIERPLTAELDVCGWELRKALALLNRGNPTMIEWLDSPVAYRQDDMATDRLRQLIPDCFSALKASHHYLSIARKNFRTYLLGERVRLKKYFYVLRSLLAVQWIAEGKGAPPMQFEVLLNAMVTDPALLEEVRALLKLKCSAVETDTVERQPHIHAFIVRSLETVTVTSQPAKDKRINAALDRLLYETVMTGI